MMELDTFNQDTINSTINPTIIPAKCNNNLNIGEYSYKEGQYVKIYDIFNIWISNNIDKFDD